MKSLLLLAFAALTLSAQDAQVRVHLTQAVAAGDNWLQPGDYTITPVNSAADVPVLRIQSANGRSVFVFADKQYQAHIEKTDVLIENTGAAPHIAKIELAGEDVEYDLVNPTSHLTR